MSPEERIEIRDRQPLCCGVERSRWSGTLRASLTTRLGLRPAVRDTRSTGCSGGTLEHGQQRLLRRSRQVFEVPSAGWVATCASEGAAWIADIPEQAAGPASLFARLGETRLFSVVVDLPDEQVEEFERHAGGRIGSRIFDASCAWTVARGVERPT